MSIVVPAVVSDIVVVFLSLSSTHNNILKWSCALGSPIFKDTVLWFSCDHSVNNTETRNLVSSPFKFKNFFFETTEA